MQVFGPTRINVHALLEGLRQQGDVVLIGSETGITENKWIRCVHSCVPRCEQLQRLKRREGFCAVRSSCIYLSLPCQSTYSAAQQSVCHFPTDCSTSLRGGSFMREKGAGLVVGDSCSLSQGG